MNIKKFVYIFISVLVVFVLYNFIVWNTYTEKLLGGKGSGDLVRMGYISELANPKEKKETLPIKHLEASEYDGSQVDMITIGDSFSNGGGGGLNPYFQDYIATATGFKVLNLSNYQEKTRSFVETVYLLGNNGFLEQKKVKYILLESVQRKVTQRFVTQVDKEINDKIENINKFYKFNTHNDLTRKKIDKKNVNNVPVTPFINNGNVKFVLYNILYNFSDNGYISQVYKTKISKNLFSIGDSDLIFYKNDLARIDQSNIKNFEIINKNLNELAQYLEKKSIKLIFMPAVNKFDLYSSYIVNNKYPHDKFFELFETMKKEYIFINTKKILAENLHTGEKDVFHVDDTHWSYKASKAVTSEIVKLINQKDIKN